VDWTKPVARFEEAIATIRALWDSGGELRLPRLAVFPAAQRVFDLPPFRGHGPKSGSAPTARMLRATGRYGDAWLPGFPATR